MQIQADETPRFDVFISFGAFHISLAYFGCLGSFIDGLGGPNILTETEVLASGSLRGFILGKHYNRCKRIHPMLATALTQLHFQAYPATIDKDTDGIHQMLQTFNADPSPASLEVLEQSEEYFDLMTRYELYCDETMLGVHGSTQKYWMMYIKLVQRWLLFNRACRTNDVSLFMYALERMIPVFFAGNRPNYSRWMVKYYMNLINCEETHPGIMHMLEMVHFQ
jgi:hypothetical protein